MENVLMTSNSGKFPWKLSDDASCLHSNVAQQEWLGVEDSLSSSWRNQGTSGKKISGIATCSALVPERARIIQQTRLSLFSSELLPLCLFVKCMGMQLSALLALWGSYSSLCMLESMDTDPAEYLLNVWYAAIVCSMERVSAPTDPEECLLSKL